MSISLPPNVALQKLQRGEVVHMYALGNFASPRLVDLVCQSGHFDLLWFDLEHFDIPTSELATLNLTARAWPVTTLARCFVGDYQTAARLLEAGSGALMCAMVDSPQHARDIVRWSKFNNPEPVHGEVIGQRGWNGGGIDARYGNLAPSAYVRHQNTQTMLICQIETPTAVAKAAEIVAVPGIDGLFFGPGDFAHLLGAPGQLGHPEVSAAMQRVASAAASAGKWWGTIGPTAELYQRARSLGARVICPGSDVKTLNLGLRELVKVMAPPVATNA
jgi:4-hydroxy-2-oxoheptanedioate aldolase